MSSLAGIGVTSIASVTPKSSNLYAQKADCERQLADWTHCVSRFTPRGKEKIEELRSKLKDIDTQLQAGERKRADRQSAAGASPPIQVAFDGKTASASVSRPQATVDTYA